MNEPLEEYENTSKLSSLQFCYSGQSNDQEWSQFSQFIQLQNTIIPYRLYPDRKAYQLYKGFYNILLSDQVVYTLQVGQQKPTVNDNLIAAYYYMKTYNITVMLNQIQQGEEMLVYVFYVFPGTRIAFGSLNSLNLPIDSKILKIRVYVVLETGLILADTGSSAKWQYFQNVSGFTNHQFEIIKNKTLGRSIQNECEQSKQVQILCLFNDKKQEQFIFSSFSRQEQIQFTIIVSDGSFINEIRNEFNESFNSLINTQIQIILIAVFSILIICIPIQAILIIKLKRPLQQLVEIAQYNIIHNQYKFQTMIRTKDRNLIKKLQDSYFDLINQNKNHNNDHVKQFENNNLYYQQLGQIQKQEEYRIIRILKTKISSLIK